MVEKEINNKINAEELIKVFKDMNQDAFELYLKSIWKVKLYIKEFILGPIQKKQTTRKWY